VFNLHREIPKGTYAAGAPNERGVRKKYEIFKKLRRRISETVQDMTKVTMTD